MKPKRFLWPVSLSKASFQFHAFHRFHTSRLMRAGFEVISIPSWCFRDCCSSIGLALGLGLGSLLKFWVLSRHPVGKYPALHRRIEYYPTLEPNAMPHETVSKKHSLRYPRIPERWLNNLIEFARVPKTPTSRGCNRWIECGSKTATIIPFVSQ